MIHGISWRYSLSCCAVESRYNAKAMQQGGSRPTSQQPTDRPIIPRYLAEVGPVRETRRCTNDEAKEEGEKPRMLVHQKFASLLFLRNSLPCKRGRGEDQSRLSGRYCVPTLARKQRKRVDGWVERGKGTMKGGGMGRYFLYAGGKQ
ncbi:hypothetical protein H105_00537 [Trichophyton soudanense CBS 452.61]|uniref:Uncharacterized protein n=1 Tax=Trichophyton soudanense CBS 452.61 TaxID=1215331 RepID=A0A022Y633_TRISD|nr:hypothetical protein H105_00537 [Trichophyton soudanense CBS 452.61]EZG10858.1 hypothetical protein H106_00430 [Trichophyton rubrum CBS 735.88]